MWIVKTPKDFIKRATSSHFITASCKQLSYSPGKIIYVLSKGNNLLTHDFIGLRISQIVSAGFLQRYHVFQNLQHIQTLVSTDGCYWFNNWRARFKVFSVSQDIILSHALSECWYLQINSIYTVQKNNITGKRTWQNKPHLYKRTYCKMTPKMSPSTIRTL